jgi:nucleoside-diphosphate-sugar epimerase
MKILLTGSSSAIGTRLFEKLLELNYDVIGADRKENK